MARSDMAGFFWDDTPAPKPPKAEKEKRTPPEPTWLRPDYLPGLQEALAFPVDRMSDADLVQAAWAKEPLLWDVECYENYFLLAFMSYVTGKVFYFELTPTHPLAVSKLAWVLNNFELIDFNGNGYDVPIASLALSGATNTQLMLATQEIIAGGTRPSDVLKRYKVKTLKVNHIDLIEVAPLFASLKIYGGRLHARKMQDLPFPPGIILNSNQMAIVRWYCVNDLGNTKVLREGLNDEIALRERMSKEYKIDLRSKSDAQIAEAVISQELEALNPGKRIARPQVRPGEVHRYRVPAFLRYETPLLNNVLNIVRNARFVVGEDGRIGMPPELSSLQLVIGESVYRMGIGGLHSSEERRATIAGPDYVLVDRDVESYYPSIILLLGLYPEHLGPDFLQVYKKIVDRRLHAKHTGDKVTASTLKITINGSFGKLGSQYSVLYSPSLLIQVTITGQLSLLMLIERLELRGITVVSGNTDGIAIKCPRHRKAEMDEIIAQWERDTRFKTEETEYRALYSRDVNNYIAVKMDGECKTKGAFANPKKAADQLHKNPTSPICVQAVVALLGKGVPLVETIRGCKDIRQFVSIRTVKGGAVRDGVFLGKSIRWYYAAGLAGEIVVATSGNKVPRTEGARPLMELPDALPDDVDFDWYIREAESMLVQLAYSV